MNILRAPLRVVVLTILVSAGVYGIANVASGGSVNLPGKVAVSTPCPVAGCTSSSCHGADRLVSYYNEPKTTSLNLWILGLSLFTVAMVAIARYM